MELLIENWYVLLVAFAVICSLVYAIYVFIKRPSTEQINSVKEQLLYAVTKAEKELGSGTGKVKLRYVYDMFLNRFPALALVISFEAFSLLVDEALNEFKDILEKNNSVKEYVENKEV